RLRAPTSWTRGPPARCGRRRSGGSAASAAARPTPCSRKWRATRAPALPPRRATPCAGGRRRRWRLGSGRAALAQAPGEEAVEAERRSSAAEAEHRVDQHVREPALAAQPGEREHLAAGEL